jgi:serine/threonine-protein kinase SRPK3
MTRTTASSSSSSSSSESEDEGRDGYKRGGYHPVSIGERFGENGRYEVKKKLGWGHFSTCWLCEDTLDRGSGTTTARALKIQKSSGSYTEAARDEIEILKQLRRGDDDDQRNSNSDEDGDDRCLNGSAQVVRLYDSFTHEGPNGTHVCMVFDVLGDNLLTLIKRYDYLGVPLLGVKSLTRSVLRGLNYLHGRRILFTQI